MNLTLAIEHLKSARSILGNELVTKFQESDSLDPSIMNLAEGINGLSEVITKLESDFLGDEWIVRISDSNGVTQERRYARGLRQALRYAKEMEEEFPGLECSFEEPGLECSIEES